ncbi:hypothetical protein J1791_01045, partial [Rahnella aceris]|nr:hypothetical protein [Rahnella aceris]
MHIIGGVYREICLRPHWNYIYGSGGRAALAMCEMGVDIHLHTYLGNEYKKYLEIEADFCSGKLTIDQYKTDEKLELSL